jgi:hypothetical protein
VLSFSPKPDRAGAEPTRGSHRRVDRRDVVRSVRAGFEFVGMEIFREVRSHGLIDL